MPISFTNPGVKYSRQSAAPTNPNLGDMWDELSSGNLVEKWLWNGSNWISNIKEWSWFESGVTINSFGYPLSEDYRYRLLSWEYTLISNNTWNASNACTVTFGRANAATNTNIRSTTYTSGTVQFVRKIKELINTDLDTTVTIADRLFFLSSITGTANYNFSTLLKYQLIRR